MCRRSLNTTTERNTGLRKAWYDAKRYWRSWQLKPRHRATDSRDYFPCDQDHALKKDYSEGSRMVHGYLGL